MNMQAVQKRRRSIRLKGYDYTQSGFYFITLCVQSRGCLFGDIQNSKMVFKKAGHMVNKTWDELPSNYPGVGTDQCAIMPNHIHGIIILDNPVIRHKKLSLPDVVHRFKTLTTKRYIEGVKKYNWKRFDKKLWQRNYYEHIIRNDNELNNIRKYIQENPIKWDKDKENPNRMDTR